MTNLDLVLNELLITLPTYDKSNYYFTLTTKLELFNFGKIFDSKILRKWKSKKFKSEKGKLKAFCVTIVND